MAEFENTRKRRADALEPERDIYYVASTAKGFQGSKPPPLSSSINPRSYEWDSPTSS